MMLRSIQLQNVRRFVEPVTVDGIGPGLNVLCEPNERGKSTIFDALHALFFFAHTAGGEKVARLVPHQGGAPEVAVELDLEGARYRIEKRWLSKKSARVLENGRLIAQADQAERWIEQRLLPDGVGGAAGLLWVSQGRTDLGGTKDPTLGTRRELITSVAGEVDAVTGGRAADRVLQTVTQALEEVVTSRGAKVGGPLHAAEKALAEVIQQRDQAAEKARAVEQAVAERARLRRERDGLADPEAVAERQRELREAEGALAAAKEFAARVTAADLAAERAKADAERCRRERDGLRDALAGRETLAVALGRAEAGVGSLRAELNGAEARHGEAVAAARTADEARIATAADLARANRAAQAAGVAEKRAALAARIGRAEALRAAADQAGSDASAQIAAKALARLEALDDALRIAMGVREAGAVAVTVRYWADAFGAVSLGGRRLGDGERVPLPEGGRLEVDGVGAVEIAPGQGQADGVEAARRALAEALAGLGLPSLEAARLSDAARRAAEARRLEAEAGLKSEAPDGMDALRASLAALPAPPEDAEGAPTVEAATEADARAQEAARRAQGEAAAAQERRADLRARHDAAVAERARLAGEVERAEAGLAGIADGAAELQRRTLAATDAEARERSAVEAVGALRADAPDLAAAEARLKRRMEAARQAAEALQAVERALLQLETRIEIEGGAGHGERLAELEEAVKRAEATRDRQLLELEVLRLLKGEIEAARRTAQDRYLEPVLAELRPLARALWPGAEFRFDLDRSLPTALVRSGLDEAVDILSGGTREQVALLVRLAFARLFARRGRAVPIILDDAMVYTDDDRIERMFDTLTALGDGQQVLVFSCRQRAFSRLGGRMLRIGEAALVP